MTQKNEICEFTPFYVGEIRMDRNDYLRYEIRGFDLVVKNPRLEPDPLDGLMDIQHDGIFHTASLDPKCGGLIAFEEVEGGTDYDNIVEAVQKAAQEKITPDQGYW